MRSWKNRVNQISLVNQVIFLVPPGVYPGGEEILQRDFFAKEAATATQPVTDGLVAQTLAVPVLLATSGH